MSKKLIIIGLDGVPWRVLDKMIEEGATPNLAKLKESGTHGVFKTTIPPLTPPAWSSIQTGVNPGKHGVFSFQGPNRKKGKREGGPPVTVNSEDIQTMTFPEYLDNAGLKAVLVNLPLTHPPRTNFPTVGSIFSNKKVTPESLEKKYDFSDYEISVKGMTETNVVANLKNIYKNVEKNFPVIKEMYQNEEWDLFFYMFSQTDWCLHQAGEDFYLGKDEDRAEWVKKIYHTIDDKVGWFMEDMDEETNLLIMSDHGFDYYNKQLSPANKLRKQELIKVKPKSVEWKSGNTVRDNIIANIFRIGLHSKSISRSLEYRYPWFCNKNMEQVKEESVVLAGDPKFPAFFLNDERFFDFVHDQEENIAKIGQALYEYSDKIKIHSKDEIYWGDQMEWGPEFIAMPGKYLPKMFLINREVVSGEFQHSIDGIFMAYGPDIDEGEINGSSVYDITPTILHYFNILLSTEFDGNVLKGIYKENSEFNREAKYAEKEEEKTLKESIKKLKV